MMSASISWERNEGKLARREYKYAGEREKDEDISAKKNIITYKCRDFLNKNITRKEKRFRTQNVTDEILILN